MKVLTKRNKERMAVAGKIFVGVVYALPIIVCLLFSIQPNEVINSMPLLFRIDKATLENYIYILENIPIWNYLKNSIIIVLMVVPCQMILASLSAFVFAFFEFRFKDTLFALYLAATMIPSEVLIVSNFVTIQNMGLLNTYLGMTITSLVGVGSIFMLRQNMKSLPKELWEAAAIDGCTEMKYFWKVVLPLCKSVITSQVITAFIGSFNAYFWPLMVTTREDYYTVQLGMAKLTGDAAFGYGYVLAGAILCMLIPVVVFIFFQDSIVKGMTDGAVKS